MRHRKHNVKFGRQTSHYKATLRQLVSGLIINKSISTTKVRAKETSRIADKLVTMGKNKTVANQRKAYSILRDRNLVSILFNDIAPLFKDRNGGYTRVMLTRRRLGDNAQMSILEFVEKPKPLKEEKKKEDKKKLKKPVIKEEPKAIKEEPVKKKQEPNKTKVEVKKEPEKPKEEPKKKPGFFKKLFGGKKD